MTVNPYSVIKGINVFKDKSVSMFLIRDIKVVKPFSFEHPEGQWHKIVNVRTRKLLG